MYRNGAVWTCLTTRHNGGEPQNRAALHWLQIDPLDATGPTLVQEDIYGASGTHYYDPAVMPTPADSLVVVFCRSSATEFAGAHVSGRTAVDALGTLQPSASIQAGLAHYTGMPRWGDYAGVGLDPADPQLVWTYTRFADIPANWGTAVGSLRL